MNANAGPGDLSSVTLTASAKLIGCAANIVRAKFLTAFAIAVIAVTAVGWTATAAADREAEARRLFVEAAKITRSGPCKEYHSLLSGSVGWALVVIGTRLGTDRMVPCLNHYREAARIYDRILDEYPETEAAFRIAGDAYPSEGTVDKILADIKKRKPAKDKKRVSNIQKKLLGLGYSPGSLDGILGPDTRSAIREYQHREGLTVDGKPSDELLSHLRISALELLPESERRKSRTAEDYIESILRDEYPSWKEEQSDKKLAKKTEPAPPQPRPSFDQRLTISELDSIRRQIEACWNIPAGARDAESLIIDIKVVMNPDGTVQRAEIMDRSRLTRDPFFRAAAESALRAVLHPRCSPLRLPPQRYQQWKTFILSFNPKELIGS